MLYFHDGQNLFEPHLSYAGIDWEIDAAMTRLIGEKKDSRSDRGRHLEHTPPNAGIHARQSCRACLPHRRKPPAF